VGAGGHITPPDVSQRAAAGDAGAASGVDSWFPSLYACLRDIAERRFRHEAPGHTLQPTALVHDAYLRLSDLHPSCWRDKTHFFAVAARAVREVLVDHGRRRRAAKRGGEWYRVSLESAADAALADVTEVVAVDDALARLAVGHERAARIVELRYFGGLTIEETAGVLDVSIGTVKADWRFARAWLTHELDAAPS
jgi:RNA polymerase sigma factor (TIGR02999 family)